MPYLRVVEDRIGNILSRMRRRVGMQAQMMPTLTSMVDHCDTLRLSQVGLDELANEIRDSRRMMLMTVTLSTKGATISQANILGLSGELTRYPCKT